MICVECGKETDVNISLVLIFTGKEEWFCEECQRKIF